MPTSADAPDDIPTVEPHRSPPRSVELVKEATVMALYVAVCLLAALSAIAERASDGHVRAFAVIWGTTIGLALAHAFAFRLSARLVAKGRLRREDGELVAAQLAGAALVAIVATVPVLVFPPTAELDVARLALALFIGLVAFTIARQAGASRGRSLSYTAIVLVLAVAIAIVTNVLSGH